MIPWMREVAGSVFVGRERELATLAAALTARAGVRCMVVDGEPGIGSRSPRRTAGEW